MPIGGAARVLEVQQADEFSWNSTLFYHRVGRRPTPAELRRFINSPKH